MNVFEFVIILVIVVLVYQLWELKIKRKEAPAEEESGADMQAQLEDLERRIEVLERIVTDSQYDLNKQFRDLEDGPENTAGRSSN